MSQWLQWMVLTALTGSPLLSLAILVVVWFVADRFTLRLLPDVWRPFVRWRRAGQLARTLAANPHDRRARHELAELRLGRRRYKEAVALLRPNLEAGDDDVETLYLLSVALYGAGHLEQAEKLMAHALEAGGVGFRSGALLLEQGRWRLHYEDWAGARAVLERLVHTRQGTVEGRVLLARALAAQGDVAGARRLRTEAWSEHRQAPRFQRRAQRLWAWRAQPLRPLGYLALLLLAGLLVSRYVAPEVSAWAGHMNEPYAGDDEP